MPLLGYIETAKSRLSSNQREGTADPKLVGPADPSHGLRSADRDDLDGIAPEHGSEAAQADHQTTVQSAFRQFQHEGPGHVEPLSVARQQAAVDYEGETTEYVCHSSTLPLPSPPARPTASSTFDIHAYPHILSHILALSSPATIAVLLRCSKDLFHTIAPHLYQNLRVTVVQMNALVASGCTLSVFGASSDLPSTFSSAFSREMLRWVRSITYIDYGLGPPLQWVPGECFPNVEVVTLRIPLYTEGYCLPASIGGLKAPKLVIWLSESYIKKRLPDEAFYFESLPSCVRDVTVLISSGFHLPFPPLILNNSAIVGRSVTIVLLPSPSPAWRDLKDRWLGFPGEYVYKAGSITSRIVGFEYVDMPAAEIRRHLNDAMEDCQNSEGVKHAPPVFMRFKEWLEQERGRSGSIFTLEEEHELRMADEELTASLKIRK